MCMAQSAFSAGCEAVTSAKALQTLGRYETNQRKFESLQDESHISKAYTDTCCTNTDIQNEKSITKRTEPRTLTN
jgi:hypothetical protein